jgi:hypothetical protein
MEADFVMLWQIGYGERHRVWFYRDLGACAPDQ